MALLYRNAPPNVIRPTIAVVFTIGITLSLTFWALGGEASMEDVRIALALLPAMVGGFWVSGRIKDRISAEDIRLAILREKGESLEIVYSKRYFETVGEPVARGELQLIDFDRVDLSNVTTQGYGVEDARQQRLKVEALAESCWDFDPTLNIATIVDRFRPKHDTAPVVFCCVDSISARTAD